MRTWLDLLALRWITSADGFPAFWKLDHMQATAWLWVVTYMLHLDGALAASLWQLVSTQIMLVGAGHGLKGYTVFVNSKAAPDVKATVDTKVTADLTAIMKEVLHRRASSDHPGTEPAP